MHTDTAPALPVILGAAPPPLSPNANLVATGLRYIRVRGTTRCNKAHVLCIVRRAVAGV